MKVVALVSGGLDSTLMTVLSIQQGLEVYPLFVDYGQLAKDKEFQAMQLAFSDLNLPTPKSVDISGFGKLLPCGLTSKDKDIFMDAFLPNRNLMFLLLGASYAYEVSANTVTMGLLHEDTTIFPDQTPSFVEDAERLVSQSLGRDMKFLLPLNHMVKADVVSMAKQHGISKTYSCHSGDDKPCGVCVACKEFEGLEI